MLVLCRSAVPTPIHYPFLESLGLKSVIVLSNDTIDEEFLRFLDSHSIRIVNAGELLGLKVSFNTKSSHHKCVIIIVNTV